MTDEAMSPLRRRTIEDMTIRKLAPKTQQGYIRTIDSHPLEWQLASLHLLLHRKGLAPSTPCRLPAHSENLHNRRRQPLIVFNGGGMITRSREPLDKGRSIL